MSIVPHSVHVREVEYREQRIANLEAEVQRLGNIITALADALSRANCSLLSVGRLPFYAERY